jgi:4-amino-4-deoxy-L-arabinose transferase-like glycosyltransferase
MRDLWWAAAAGGLPFLVYLRTMAPTVYALDSAELTTGARVLGIVHAPGSPTFMLLGHLFSLLPIGDVGYRLNLFSASAAAAAVALLYLVGRRVVDDRPLALAGSWCLAFSYYFWISALAAELYAPQACCLALLLLLAIRWRESGDARFLVALSFTFGLALGIHVALILTLPGLLWLSVRAPLRRRVDAPLLAITAICGLAGACVYLYLPWRQAADTPLDYTRAYWHVDLATARGLWWMISGQMFAASFFGVHGHELPRELSLGTWRLWSNFAGLGALLGVVGLTDGLRRHGRIFNGLVMIFAAHTIFFLLYRVTDKELMFLPAYLVWALWIMLGAQQVAREIRRRLADPWSPSAATLLFCLAAALLLLNFRAVDLSDDVSARVAGERVFSTLPSGAVFLGSWGDIPVLEYLQLVEGRRPDVTLLNLVFLPGKAKATAARHLAARERVFTSTPAALGEKRFRFAYRRDCQCYLVRWSRRERQRQRRRRAQSPGE